MKITKVNYTKSYTIGPFLQEKVGFEAEIDGTCESPESALNELKRIADQWHIVNNPQVHYDGSSVSWQKSDEARMLPEIKSEKPVEEDNRIQVMMNDLYDCKTAEELKSFDLVATALEKKSDFRLRYAYNEKLKQLTENK
jgi:hypothetical protein